MKKLILMVGFVLFLLSCSSKSATKNIVVEKPTGFRAVLIEHETAMVVGESMYLHECLLKDLWIFVHYSIDDYKAYPEGIKVCCSPPSSYVLLNEIQLKHSNRIDEIEGCLTFEEYLPLYESQLEHSRKIYCTTDD